MQKKDTSKEIMYYCILDKGLNLAISLHPTMEKAKAAKDKYVAEITEECFELPEEESGIRRDRDYDRIFKENAADVTIHPVLLYL